MGGESPRIMIMEDDEAVRESVAAALRDQGYQVHPIADGLRIGSVLEQFRPDLAIIDVGMATGPSGLSVTRHLRRVSDLPVLMLTALDGVDDRLHGFDAGADDYLAKPFALAELLARVRALLRRSGVLTSATWQVDDLVVDESARSVSRGDRRIELTRTEFDLLTALGSKPGRVRSKAQLLAIVWEFTEYDPNLVEVHVSSLRRKLEADGASRLIHTMRGSGYVLKALS